MLTQEQTMQKSVRYLKGIGPRRLEAFKKLGIETLCDLFYFFPRRYDDRRQRHAIRDVRIGDQACIQGVVLTRKVRPLKSFQLFELIIEDETSQIAAVWFNQPYMMNVFKEGDVVLLSGKIDFRKQLQITNPDYEIIKGEESEVIHAGRVVPIYPLTEGLMQRAVRKSMKELVDQYIEYVEEFLPPEVLKSNQLISLQDALRIIHFPEDGEALERARRRLIFDELFLFELGLLRDVRLLKKEESAVPLKNGHDLANRFRASLGFELTAGQNEVINEIIADTAKAAPMTRLLQGEVGCGKTVVAMFALLLGAKSDVQGVFLAPTEILAAQQYAALAKQLKPFGMRVTLLTGSTAVDEKEGIYESIREGLTDVVVATHAVLQERVRFKQLGVVVIDEQHKFGVRQRNILLSSTPRAHLLIMTATPIPRTLGLTLFGDLDISTIRELPIGRRAVKTYWIAKKCEKDIWTFVTEQVEQGKQAYVICPRIGEGEKDDIESAVNRHRELSQGVLRKFQIGLLHGRLHQSERDRAMKSFREGSVPIMVATSMVEVGLHNPRATVMVVYDADRFGLAQLHQMRGRVGRSAGEAYCFLFADTKNDESSRRLRILTKTNDGFEIAEEDLKLRGAGDFLGIRQSGLPWFRLVEFPRDYPMMVLARENAARILKEDLNFCSEKYAALKKRLEDYCRISEDPV